MPLGGYRGAEMLKKEGKRRGPGALRYREGVLYSDRLFAWSPEFLVTPLLMGLFCL